MKLKALGLALLLILLASVSTGTLAYFVAEDIAHNVITSGGVDIDLIEMVSETDPWPEGGMSGVMPGEDVAKIVTVENTGVSDAWIRVKVDVSVTLADGTEGDPEYLSIDFKDGWTEKDGYWYYNAPTKTGDITTPLFTTVTFAADMGNDYQNCTVSVDVSAQAVQVANNGETVMEAAGWPAE